MESGERAQAIEDALEPLHNLHDEAQDGIAQVLKEQLDGERSLHFHLDRFIRHHKGNIPLCKIFHAHIDGISVCVGDLPALEFVILFDVENGKTGNLAAILFGVLRSGKEYISQKYSESLQKELDAELARIQQAEESQKKLAETKLQIQFREFLVKNPNFLEEVREKHKGFVKNQDLLEKMAFEEFRTGTLNV